MVDENLTVSETADVLFKIGHFGGSLRLMGSAGYASSHSKHLSFLNHYFLGSRKASELLPECAHLVKNIGGTQHLPELILLLLGVGRLDEARKALAELMGICDQQHGRIVIGHPSSVLDLVEACCGDLEDREAGILLFSAALCTSKVYVIREDLRKAARLLVALSAPAMMWADWAALFINHVLFSVWRKEWLKDNGSVKGGYEWAAEEDRLSEAVLLETLKIGPPELGIILSELSVRLDGGIEEAIKERTVGPSQYQKSGRVPESYLTPRCHQYRLPWFEHLNTTEKNFLTNGEWALFCSPTQDYSMGLAQWWRTLESAFNRVLISPLAEYLQANSQAIGADKALSPARQKDEAIFLERLVDPVKSKKLTLWDILLVINKCSVPGDITSVQSSVRRLAIGFVRERFSGVERLVHDGYMSPLKLTERNINDFRNRASHHSSVDLVQAAVGRTLVRLLFAEFYEPMVHAPEWCMKFVRD